MVGGMSGSVSSRSPDEPMASSADGGGRSRRLIVAAVIAVGVLTAAGAVTALVVSRSSMSASSTLSASPISQGEGSVLHSVACTSPMSCLAVGSYSVDGSADRQKGLVESWDGVSWAVVPAPNPAADTELEAIACASPVSCTAVGSSGPGNPILQRALAEHWDGSAWSVVHVPTPDGKSTLRGVRCLSVRLCISVGEATTAGSPSALVESWDGTSWSAVSAPQPHGSAESWLDSLSCSSPTSCMAVGAYSTSGDFDDPISTTLTESWNGAAWSVVPSPTPGSGNLGALNSVSCAAASSCLAVGSYSRVNNPYKVDDQGLVEAWNGSAWTVTPSGGVGIPNQRVLRAIVCASRDHCIAVGSSTDQPYGTVRSLVETWNGATWAAARPQAVTGELESVACVSSRVCLAVGQRTAASSSFAQPLAVWLHGAN